MKVEPTFAHGTMGATKTAPNRRANVDRSLAKSTPISTKTREVSMASSHDTSDPGRAVDPGDKRHGTNVGYNLGCRDDCCRHAHMVWMKKWRLYGSDRMVSGQGFTRRVRALQAIGYTSRTLSAELGRSKSFVDATVNQRHVRRETHDAMDAVYERLCMTPPVGWVADRARRRAAERGYASPLAWDDIDMDESPAAPTDDGSSHVDEVKVQRVLDGTFQQCNRAERAQVIERWTGSRIELIRLTGWNLYYGNRKAS